MEELMMRNSLQVMKKIGAAPHLAILPTMGVWFGCEGVPAKPAKDLKAARESVTGAWDLCVGPMQIAESSLLDLRPAQKLMTSASNEKLTKTVLQQIAEALRHIHHKGFVYHDIQPRKIMLKEALGRMNL